MSALDSILPQAAYDIIEAYGKDLTFYNNAGTGASYNPDTRETTLPSETTYTVKCSPPEYEKRYELGQAVHTGRLEIIIPDLNLDATFRTTVLDMGTRVDIDSDSWMIVQIDRLYSGDDIAAYRCILEPRRVEVP
jgi:hypothetical protein